MLSVANLDIKSETNKQTIHFLSISMSKSDLYFLFCRHFLIEPEEAFQASLIIWERGARIATFNYSVELFVSLTQILWHLFGVVEVGKRLLGIVGASKKNIGGCFLYLRLLGVGDGGEGEGIVAETCGISVTSLQSASYSTNPCHVHLACEDAEEPKGGVVDGKGRI